MTKKPDRDVNADDPVTRIVLTFDDGPHQQHTATILDILSAQRVPATFFVLGKNVERYGLGLLERAANEGHLIGNHAFSHVRLTTLNWQDVEAEIDRTDRLIQPFLGRHRLFRPPYGAASVAVTRIAQNLGYRNVLWDVDTRDWDEEYQSDRWVRHGLECIPPGERSIVLAHDIHATTAEHLNSFLTQLRQTGAVFLSLDDHLYARQ